MIDLLSKYFVRLDFGWLLYVMDYGVEFKSNLIL